jgi:hypothetical protein
VCRKLRVSETNFYKWEAKFGGMEVSDAPRIRQLEEENARLKKTLVDAMLDNAVLQDVALKNCAVRGKEGRCVGCAAGARHQRAAGMCNPRSGPDVSPLHRVPRR